LIRASQHALLVQFFAVEACPLQKSLKAAVDG